MKIGTLAVTGTAVLALITAGCSAGKTPAEAALQVTSTEFADGAPIPDRYACAAQGGDNVSPPLAWTGVPGSARELAIVVDDPDAPGGSYIHWIVTGIPPSTKSAPEGKAPGEVQPGSDGTPAYTGPCPPSGTHHYHFIVYALPTPIHPSGDAQTVHQQIKDAAMASGETTGTWGR
jgi:Raf kinase inhibitor-like YbhB/YbcL family protein